MHSRKMDSVFFALIYIILFMYLYFLYKPSLLYCQFQPAFFFDRHFLTEFTQYPGGLADLLSLFFFQFFFNNLLGSLLFALILTTLTFIVHRMFGRLFRNTVFYLPAIVPLVFLFILYNDYRLPLVVGLKLLLVLCMGFLYSNSKFRTRLLLLCLSPLFYWVLGGWFFLFFVALILIIHIVSGQSALSFGVPLLFLLAAVLFPYLAARYIFQITLKEAFLYLLPNKFYYEPVLFKPTLSLYLLFISVPILLVVWKLGTIFFKKFEKSRFTSGKTAVFLVFDIAACLVLLALSSVLSTQPDQKRKIYIDDLAERGQWDQLLLESKKMTSYDIAVEFQTNRAMYFTGCLLDSLFTIEHPVGVNGLFIDRLIASQIARHASDLYFDLAHNNAAQVMAYEYNTKFRYNPQILKRLLRTNLVNDSPAKAEKFFKLLNKSIVHKSWIRAYAPFFENNTVANIADIEAKQKFKPKRDFFINAQSPNAGLLHLLESNSGNKMAFEYLMACYLLTGRLGNFARELHMYKQFDYKTVPRHLQEAAIFYQTGAKQAGNELISNFPFQRDMILKFRKFNQVAIENRADKKVADKLLKQEFGDTFWYYLYSGGATRTDALKKRKIESLY